MDTNGAYFENADDAISTYVTLRDALRDFQKEVKEKEERFKMELDRIEMWLRDLADKLGVESIRSESGTAYKVLKESYKIADFELFTAYILETGNLQLLEKRVAKNAAREVHRELGDVPPGLDYLTEIAVNVKRPTKSKTKETDDE